jgi:multiple sugar transport system ATP-binding protein
MAAIDMTGISKRFGDVDVIRGVDLTVEDGEFCVLVGPSGCGKSTLLRLIAGLEDITQGTLSIGGRVVNDVRSKDRGVSMVFQSYALYPHMTVYKNMAFGLTLTAAGKEDIDRRVRQVAETLQLTDLLDRKPKELSGGQRQRVAIGRAIVRDPDVFLFDEPLSNLDAALRVQMRLELRRLHERLGATVVHVTHDQIEAMTLADRIVVLNDGQVEQQGAPRDLYDAPANTFVAQFIGSPAMNLLAGRIENGRIVTQSGADLGAYAAPDQAITIGVRPEHLTACGPSSNATLPFSVELVEDLGDACYAYGVSGDTARIAVKLSGDTAGGNQKPGHLRVESGRVHVFDRNGVRMATV